MVRPGDSFLIQNAHHPGTAYRPDIDGLRAVAVMPVVLFHLGLRGFWGGFVGVDVFFVISGYLITGIIEKELREGRFSMAEFYRRRILRIFPALFVMMGIVAVCAGPLMLPLELIRFAKSALATTGFASNILYYTESGYFAPDAHTKPLLHTWSLAVEEQFYVFWPIALAWLFPKLGRRLWIAAAGVALLSLVVAIWSVEHAPSAAFYLIPSRTWELLTGALLVLIPWPSLDRRWLRESLAACGLLMILLSVKFYSEFTPFPGLAAVPPCLGAALLILTGAGARTRAAQLLSWPPLVAIGKISFSLYLWHWPVIVLARTVLFVEPSLSAAAGELAASLALAAMSWRFVEQPFRTGQGLAVRERAFSGAGVAMASVVTISLGVLWLNGIPGRFTPTELAVASYEDYDGDSKYRGGSCFIVDLPDAQRVFDRRTCLARDEERRNIVLLGDSHAAHLWPGLALLEPEVKILQATHTGCRPLVYPADAQDASCRSFFRSVILDWLPSHPISTVVLAGRWEWYDLPLLEQTLMSLSRSGQHVVVVGPIQRYTASLLKLLIRAGRSDDPALLLANGRVSQPFELDPAMRALTARSGAQYISLIDELCTPAGCRTLTSGGAPLQFDTSHLTVDGSRETVAMFSSVLFPAKQTMLRSPTQATDEVVILPIR